MLKNILDPLMHVLITSLSSTNRDGQYSASKSLGELVSNVGHYYTENYTYFKENITEIY